ncbi:hypothetical protein BC938DRAFT_477143 [Jimgerdemannia flammicorona]|uniref:Uncharacterized protein n=1 Tax=Jimgerdemannia flammicorona TaxID=994334 RepID=A0A433PBQ5_9FUNG|nr:hypothetical protein BC938DRAFT_477143 [Jimgerdemannia flammicorona]
MPRNLFLRQLHKLNASSKNGEDRRDPQFEFLIKYYRLPPPPNGTRHPQQHLDGIPPAYLNPVEQILCVDNVVNPVNMDAHLTLLRYFNNLENVNPLLDKIYLVKAEMRYLRWLEYLSGSNPPRKI